MYTCNLQSKKRYNIQQYVLQQVPGPVPASSHYLSCIVTLQVLLLLLTSYFLLLTSYFLPYLTPKVLYLTTVLEQYSTTLVT